MEKGLKIIGRLVEVDFPRWDLSGVRAKVDTGAYTSSIHCHRIEAFEEVGEPRVRFHLLDPSHEEYPGRAFEMPVSRRKTVRSSNAVPEERIFVKTAVSLLGMEFETEFSLTDRGGMKHPVLLGRRALRGRFMVDVSRS